MNNFIIFRVMTIELANELNIISFIQNIELNELNYAYKYKCDYILKGLFK